MWRKAVGIDSVLKGYRRVAQELLGIKTQIERAHDDNELRIHTSWQVHIMRSKRWDDHGGRLDRSDDLAKPAQERRLCPDSEPLR